ncbi:hypothetical protein Q3G72_034170 [Acer saccharum]|nr:hypothetical protein Q3G72_034170 [Acer saccharum]
MQNQVGGSDGFGLGSDISTPSFSSLVGMSAKRKAGGVSKLDKEPTIVPENQSNLIKRKDKVGFRKPKERLKPFFFGNSKLDLAKRKGGNGLAIPDEALVMDFPSKGPSPNQSIISKGGSSGLVLVSQLEGGKGPSLNVWVDLTNNDLVSKECFVSSPLEPVYQFELLTMSSPVSPLAFVFDGTIVADSQVPNSYLRIPSPLSPRKRRGKQK